MMSIANETYKRSLEEQIDFLLKEYGEGVRPGWVSTDLALLRHQLRKAKGQTDDLP